MQGRKKRRLSVENLEARYALATAAVSMGNLTITETAVAANLLVEQVDADSWDVTDLNAATTTTYNGVTGNVTIRTGSFADNIEVALSELDPVPKCLIIIGGNGDNNVNIHDGPVTLTLDIRLGSGNDDVILNNVDVGGTTALNLGHGNNTLQVADGTFTRRAIVYTGNGADDVQLGTGDTLLPLTFENSLFMLDYGGPTDTLRLHDEVVIDGSLSTDNWNKVQMDVGAEIHTNLVYNGGYDVLNDLIVDGLIDGGLTYYGNRNVDLLTLSDTAGIGRGVTAYLRAGNDSFTLADGASIGTTLNIDASTGNDTIDIGGRVFGRTTVLLGTGDDLLSYTGVTGISPSTSGRLQIDAGTGIDRVAIRANSIVHGQLSVNMGAGNDVFALDDLAVFVAANVNGGTGIDDYYGDPNRANVIDQLFENYFFPDPPPF
jgi:hypothetical protein